jgi:hypothetical protein
LPVQVHHKYEKQKNPREVRVGPSFKFSNLAKIDFKMDKKKAIKKISSRQIFYFILLKTSSDFSTRGSSMKPKNVNESQTCLLSYSSL